MRPTVQMIIPRGNDGATEAIVLDRLALGTLSISEFVGPITGTPQFNLYLEQGAVGGASVTEVIYLDSDTDYDALVKRATEVVAPTLRLLCSAVVVDYEDFRRRANPTLRGSVPLSALLIGV